MNNVMPVAIDLLWLRPGKVGGTEFYIRNLLTGMCKLRDEFNFVLICSKDNADTFDEYVKDSRIDRIIADVYSANIGKRIIWQSLNQNSLLRRNGLKYCFAPVYCRPLFNGGIRYLNTIHDIQAFHYPNYHPFYEVWFSKISWLIDKYESRHIVAISEFVKNDLIKYYGFSDDKIDVIYNPILIDKSDVLSADDLEKKYSVKPGEFYYTVAQLIPHKNLETLLRIFVRIKKENIDLPNKLIISGIKGNAADELMGRLESDGIQDNVLFTGFVDNATRNALFANCRAFLFPSVFEGFGMPAVEAMYMGKSVLTTKCASIPEVTQDKAYYVDDPYDENEWIEKLRIIPDKCEAIDSDKYNEEVIAKKYLNVIKTQLIE